MAYGFAHTANEPLPVSHARVAHTLDWFIAQLREANVSELHITWNAKEEFAAVDPQYMDEYLQYRRHYFHAEALRRAQGK